MSIAPERPAEQSRGERLFRLASMLSAAQLLWLFIMGALAGGQFTPRDDLKWEPLLEWPVVAVPSWLTIALAVLALIGAVLALFGRTGEDHRAPLFTDVGITLLVLIILPLLFSMVYLDPGGIEIEFLIEGAPVGWHWVASIFGIVTLIPLGVRMVIAERAAKLGTAQ